MLFKHVFFHLSVSRCGLRFFSVDGAHLRQDLLKSPLDSIKVEVNLAITITQKKARLR